MNDRRWYEYDDRLNRYIEGLRDIPHFERYRLVQGMMCLITEYQDDLLDRFVLDFPLEIDNGQWYDRDPDLWLVINGLQYGDQQLHHQIAAYLSAKMDKEDTAWQQLSLSAF